MTTPQSACSSQNRAAWRDMLTRPDTAPAALASVFLFASLLVLPLCTVPRVAVLYLIAVVCFYYALVRAVLAMLGLAAPLLLIYGVTGSINLTAVGAALLLGGACGAFLLIHYHHPKDPRFWGVVSVPVLAYGIAAFLTQDPVRGLLVLLPLSLSLVFAWCVLSYQSLTPSVVSGTAALTAALTVALLVTLAVTGGLSGNPVGEIAATLRAEIAGTLAQSRALYAELGMQIAMTDAEIVNTAAVTVNLMPAILIASFTALTYLSWRALLRMLVVWETLPRLPLRLGALSMSAFSAGLFIVSFVAALIANTEQVTLAGAILQSISLVLEPGLALVGFASLYARGDRRSCLTSLLSLGLIFILFSNLGTGLALAAFFGAINILMARFLPSPNEKGE